MTSSLRSAFTEILSQGELSVNSEEDSDSASSRLLLPSLCRPLPAAAEAASAALSRRKRSWDDATLSAAEDSTLIVVDDRRDSAVEAAAAAEAAFPFETPSADSACFLSDEEQSESADSSQPTADAASPGQLPDDKKNAAHASYSSATYRIPACIGSENATTRQSSRFSAASSLTLPCSSQPDDKTTATTFSNEPATTAAATPTEGARAGRLSRLCSNAAAAVEEDGASATRRRRRTATCSANDVFDKCSSVVQTSAPSSSRRPGLSWCCTAKKSFAGKTDYSASANTCHDLTARGTPFLPLSRTKQGQYLPSATHGAHAVESADEEKDLTGSCSAACRTQVRGFDSRTSSREGAVVATTAVASTKAASKNGRAVKGSKYAALWLSDDESDFSAVEEKEDPKDPGYCCSHSYDKKASFKNPLRTEEKAACRRPNNRPTKISAKKGGRGARSDNEAAAGAAAEKSAASLSAAFAENASSSSFSSEGASPALENAAATTALGLSSDPAFSAKNNAPGPAVVAAGVRASAEVVVGSVESDAERALPVALQAWEALTGDSGLDGRRPGASRVVVASSPRRRMKQFRHIENSSLSLKTTTNSNCCSGSTAAAGALGECEEDRKVLRILIATDTHVGFKAEDSIRGGDSFETLEEILQIARDLQVDLMLHGGDFFDENKPSRTTLYRTMCLLRKYCFGEGKIDFEILENSYSYNPNNSSSSKPNKSSSRKERNQHSPNNGSEDSSKEGGNKKDRTSTLLSCSKPPLEKQQSGQGAAGVLAEKEKFVADASGRGGRSFLHPKFSSFSSESGFRFGLNYLNENVSVCLPIFVMHGNHDDPGERSHLSPLDVLEAAHLINYFGRADGADQVTVRPFFIKKGCSHVAVYGIGWIRDTRLHRAFTNDKVKFLVRKDDPEARDTFNIMLIHQNRYKGAAAGQPAKDCIHEHMLPNFLDLVIWGHEHDCHTKPWESPQGEFKVLQPGSSVATSLTAGEALPKHVFLLEICGENFRLFPQRLQSVRPLLFEDLSLSTLLQTTTEKKPLETVANPLASSSSSLSFSPFLLPPQTRPKKSQSLSSSSEDENHTRRTAATTFAAVHNNSRSCLTTAGAVTAGSTEQRTSHSTTTILSTTIDRNTDDDAFQVLTEAAEALLLKQSQSQTPSSSSCCLAPVVANIACSGNRCQSISSPSAVSRRCSSENRRKAAAAIIGTEGSDVDGMLLDGTSHSKQFYKDQWESSVQQQKNLLKKSGRRNERKSHLADEKTILPTEAAANCDSVCASFGGGGGGGSRRDKWSSRESFSLSEKGESSPPQAFELFCNYRVNRGQSQSKLPLLRLRVEYSGFSTVSTSRFGAQFIGRVANPADVLLFYRKKKRISSSRSGGSSSDKANATALPELEVDDIQGDPDGSSEIRDIIFHFLGDRGTLDILPEPDLNIAVQEFVVKMDASAIAAFVDTRLQKTKKEAKDKLKRQCPLVEMRDIDPLDIQAAIREMTRGVREQLLMQQEIDDSNSAAAEQLSKEVNVAEERDGGMEISKGNRRNKVFAEDQARQRSGFETGENILSIDAAETGSRDADGRLRNGAESEKGLLLGRKSRKKAWNGQNGDHHGITRGVLLSDTSRGAKSGKEVDSHCALTSATMVEEEGETEKEEGSEAEEESTARYTDRGKMAQATRREEADLRNECSHREREQTNNDCSTISDNSSCRLMTTTTEQFPQARHICRQASTHGNIQHGGQLGLSIKTKAPAVATHNFFGAATAGDDETFSLEMSCRGGRRRGRQVVGAAARKGSVKNSAPKKNTETARRRRKNTRRPGENDATADFSNTTAEVRKDPSRNKNSARSLLSTSTRRRLFAVNLDEEEEEDEEEDYLEEEEDSGFDALDEDTEIGRNYENTEKKTSKGRVLPFAAASNTSSRNAASPLNKDAGGGDTASSSRLKAKLCTQADLRTFFSSKTVDSRSCCHVQAETRGERHSNIVTGTHNAKYRVPAPLRVQSTQSSIPATFVTKPTAVPFEQRDFSQSHSVNRPRQPDIHLNIENTCAQKQKQGQTLHNRVCGGQDIMEDNEEDDLFLTSLTRIADSPHQFVNQGGSP